MSRATDGSAWSLYFTERTLKQRQNDVAMSELDCKVKLKHHFDVKDP